MCLEGPLLAEELVNLMNAVTEIAPESVMEMPQTPTTFVVDEGDVYIHVQWGENGRRVSSSSSSAGDHHAERDGA